MKNTVLQRVIEIMKLKSNSEREFASIIGANQKTINQQLKQERSLSLDTVLNVISSFEDISAEWLLRGSGEMLLTKQSQQDTNFQISDAATEIEKLKMQIARLEGQNDLLREQIGMSETKRSKTA